MRHQMLNPYDVRFVYLGYLVHCMCDSSLLQLAWGMGPAVAVLKGQRL